MNNINIDELYNEYMNDLKNKYKDIENKTIELSNIHKPCCFGKGKNEAIKHNMNCDKCNDVKECSELFIKTLL